MAVQEVPLTPAANPNHLPFLLRLLDDESSLVRQCIARELSAFGPQLDALLDRVDPFPSLAERQFIRHVLMDFQRHELQERWHEWFLLEGEMEKLEHAYGLLADYMNGPGASAELKTSLDQLAQEFATYRPDFAYAELPILTDETDPGRAAIALSEYLFKHVGLKGAISTYNNPENCDLLHSLRHREGIPISLVCIYMLVGWRLGIDISACNWPGHFLARVRLGNSFVIVDCFREGTCLPETAFLKMQGPSQNAAKIVLDQVTDSETIILRALNNLAHAYQSIDDDLARALMIELRHKLERHILAQLG